MSDDIIYIGLDAGGSKTELLAASHQRDELLNLFSSSANPARVGFSGSIGVLSRLIRQAMEALPNRKVAAVCAGIAGAGRPAEQRRIHEGISAEISELAGEHLLITHDADIALEAAFESEGGIMVIAGTGSVALARTNDGRTKRVGGWGYLIGDEGSGYALGVYAMRAYAHALDGGPQTTLQERIAKEYDIRDSTELIFRVYEEKMPLQKLAPLVVNAAMDGDDVALQIVETQARELAAQVRWLADRDDDIMPQIALLGGVANEPFYHTVLKNALLEVLAGWSIIQPKNRPVVGAWRLAQQRAKATADAG